MLKNKIAFLNLNFDFSENIHPTKQKRVIFITARVHPGESPSSYVCEGLMEYLLENTPEAKALRDHIVFKFSNNLFTFLILILNLFDAIP